MTAKHNTLWFARRLIGCIQQYQWVSLAMLRHNEHYEQCGPRSAHRRLKSSQGGPWYTPRGSSSAGAVPPQFSPSIQTTFEYVI